MLRHVHVDVGLDVFIVYYFRAVKERQMGGGGAGESEILRARARASEGERECV